MVANLTSRERQRLRPIQSPLLPSALLFFDRRSRASFEANLQRVGMNAKHSITWQAITDCC